MTDTWMRDPLSDDMRCRVISSICEKLHVEVTNNDCKNQIWTLKKNYYIVKFPIKQSGFGWDNNCKCTTAKLKVWDAYIEVFICLIQKGKELRPCISFNSTCV
ncbi:uncharacterized protein LOC131225791 [Magnolia sinica]|uniref:uncharacterized protein LOC131225791 n=1 Tax=Magnolia sinica TaxID=86752 RepID=UPI002658CEB0|nr:uncharacterized protein LOC131225791 [Magnolia sinica]